MASADDVKFYMITHMYKNKKKSFIIGVQIMDNREQT